MKNTLKKLLIPIGILMAISFLFTFILLFLQTGNQSDYYSDKTNYEKINVEVEGIRFNENRTIIYFNQTYCFVGDNVSVVLNNNIEELINGDVVSIYVALGYFKDGYDFPIVGLEKNDTIYLNFDLGVENQIKHEEQTYKSYSKMLLTSIVFLGIMSLSFVITWILSKKK